MPSSRPGSPSNSEATAIFDDDFILGSLLWWLMRETPENLSQLCKAIPCQSFGPPPASALQVDTASDRAESAREHCAPAEAFACDDVGIKTGSAAPIRKRGRPRKYILPEIAPTDETMSNVEKRRCLDAAAYLSCEDSAASQTDTDADVKHESSPKQEGPIKRGRGRPRKYPPPENAPSEVPTTVTAKKRGRPPKTDADYVQPRRPGPKFETEIKLPEAGGDEDDIRTRGRRKRKTFSNYTDSEPEDDEMDEVPSVLVQLPRKRGRPRKHPIEIIPEHQIKYPEEDESSDLQTPTREIKDDGGDSTPTWSIGSIRKESEMQFDGFPRRRGRPPKLQPGTVRLGRPSVPSVPWGPHRSIMSGKLVLHNRTAVAAGLSHLPRRRGRPRKHPLPQLVETSFQHHWHPAEDSWKADPETSPNENEVQNNGEDEVTLREIEFTFGAEPLPVLGGGSDPPRRRGRPRKNPMPFYEGPVTLQAVEASETRMSGDPQTEPVKRKRGRPRKYQAPPEETTLEIRSPPDDTSETFHPLITPVLSEPSTSVCDTIPHPRLHVPISSPRSTPAVIGDRSHGWTSYPSIGNDRFICLEDEDVRLPFV